MTLRFAVLALRLTGWCPDKWTSSVVTSQVNPVKYLNNDFKRLKTQNNQKQIYTIHIQLPNDVGVRNIGEQRVAYTH